MAITIPGLASAGFRADACSADSGSAGVADATSDATTPFGFAAPAAAGAFALLTLAGACRTRACTVVKAEEKRGGWNCEGSTAGSVSEEAEPTPTGGNTSTRMLPSLWL